MADWNRHIRCANDSTKRNQFRISYAIGRKPDRELYQFAPRESLSGRAPYSMASEILQKEALNTFRLRPIESDQ